MTNPVSDGYHTFDELYEHRNTLFIALMATKPELSWWSHQHHDGSMFDGWLIGGMSLPTGTITYHMPIAMEPLIKLTGAKYKDKAPEWDGHDSDDVVNRIQDYIKYLFRMYP